MLWLKENWFKTGLLGLIVIAIAGYFYWNEIRPNKIRNKCAEEEYGNFGTLGFGNKQMDEDFERCLKRFGISQ